MVPLCYLVSLDFLFGESLPCHTALTVPSHTGEADSPPSTRIEKGETCVRIIFCPTLQDQSAFSSSGIMADFMVQYDVVMEDIIGDVQVLERTWVLKLDRSGQCSGLHHCSLGTRGN